MATITGLTADRMQQIIDKTIVNANIVSGHLILTLTDGTTIDAGPAQGPAGAAGAPGTGIGKGNAFPGSPAEGDLFIRTDQSGDPMYKYVGGTWISAGGGLNKVTAFPSSPQDGDVVVRTDLNGSPLYAYSTENGWEAQPRMGAVTVPSANLRRVGTQTGAVNNDMVVSFTNTDVDTNGMSGVGGANPTRLTIKTPGRYRLTGMVGFATGTPAWLALQKNGAFNYITVQAAGPSGYQPTVETTVTLVAGDYIELVAHVGASGPITFGDAANTYAQPQLLATWLGGAGQTVDERGVPAVKATGLSATQSLPNNVETAIAFNSIEEYDTDGMHDLVTNPSRFVAKTAGLYAIQAGLAWNTDTINTGGVRILRIKKNGNLMMENDRLPNTDTTHTWFQEVVGTLLLAAGDYVELVAVQDSGGSKLVGQAAGDNRNFFSMTLLGTGKTVAPFVRVNNSAAQSIPHNTATALAFNAEDSDNDGIHDTVTNTTRLVCRTAGVYAIVANAEWAGNTAGERDLSIIKNGSTYISSEIRHPPSTGSGLVRMTTSTIAELAVGDYVEVMAYQSSGAPLNVNAFASYSPEFSMAKIGSPSSPNSGIEVIEAWKTVGVDAGAAYANSWGPRSGYPTLKFRKDRGLVQFAPTTLAKATGPAAGEVIFTLPVGYRPPQDVWAIVPNHDGTTPNVAHITIGANGNVTINDAIGTARAQFVAIGPLSFAI